MERPKIAKYVFEVSGKEWITPHYIRIKLRADENIAFDQCTLGANNKIFIPPAGCKDVLFPEFDPELGAWRYPKEDARPIVRTYTHRSIDPQTKEIAIDFIDHGDNGPASAWARHAVHGDQLGVAMKIKKTPHYQQADWYFLIGDATAIPVICCILESLPPDAKGYCLIEIPSEVDIHPELRHPGFEFQWLLNAHPERGSILAPLAKEVEIPEEYIPFAYVAAEYSTVKELRQYFQEDLYWPNQQYYAFSYWKAGLAEDFSAAERRLEKES